MLNGLKNKSETQKPTIGLAKQAFDSRLHLSPLFDYQASEYTLPLKPLLNCHQALHLELSYMSKQYVYLRNHPKQLDRPFVMLGNQILEHFARKGDFILFLKFFFFCACVCVGGGGWWVWGVVQNQYILTIIVTFTSTVFLFSIYSNLNLYIFFIMFLKYSKNVLKIVLDIVVRIKS